MTVPTVATFSVAALTASNTAYGDTIDGAATAGSVKIRDSGDVLLATIVLDDPSYTIAGGTGQATFTGPGGDTGTTTGTAAYGEMCDGDDVVQLSLPAEQGTAAVSGKLVLNSLSIISGQEVQIISITVG